MIQPTYIYRASLSRVVDADTYELMVDLGMRVHHKALVRLRGFSAPENSTFSGAAATQIALKVLEPGRNRLVVQTYKDHLSFARWIADVYLDGVHVGDLLRAQGVLEGGI